MNALDVPAHSTQRLLGPLFDKTAIVVHKNAVLHHIMVVEDERSFDFTVNVLENAKYDLSLICLETSLDKSAVSIKLQSPNAEVMVNHLTLGKQSKRSHLTLTLEHLVPGCTSNTLARGIFNDKATGEFVGKIIVAPNASKTVANLETKNLLLSNHARAISCPELEIYNDEVKCTHGATVGHLDAEALFYCQSRGIPETLAKTLLVHSFASPTLTLIEEHSLLNKIETALAQLMDTTYV